MIRVAINGFGRIGRMVMRASLLHPEIQVVACNDLTDIKTLAHLFKYDSVHKKFKGTVTPTEDGIQIDDNFLNVFGERDPENLPWKELNVDVVIESTGFFRTKETASKHLIAGAKKVILSAPASSDDVRTIVMGVNEHEYNKETDHVVSNASCTTNCLAPIVKVLDDNFGIKSGFMSTVHAYTGDQKILDAPHKDLRRGRSAAVNIVPTSTGAAKAVGLVLPHLKGKLDGLAIRVPISDGSLIDLVCDLGRETTREEVNELMKNVANHHLKGILEYSDEPLVSSDIVENPHSSIFDSELTFVNKNMIKIISWYDNEWGYSNRVCDLIKIL